VARCSIFRAKQVDFGDESYRILFFANSKYTMTLFFHQIAKSGLSMEYMQIILHLSWSGKLVDAFSV
jgi:hypothetical protein